MKIIKLILCCLTLFCLGLFVNSDLQGDVSFAEAQRTAYVKFESIYTKINLELVGAALTDLERLVEQYSKNKNVRTQLEEIKVDVAFLKDLIKFLKGNLSQEVFVEWQGYFKYSSLVKNAIEIGEK